MEKTELAQSSFCKRLNIPPIRFQNVILVDGINDQDEIKRFRILQKNVELKESFSFAEVEKFLADNDIMDHEACLMWDISSTVWFKMKNGGQAPMPNFRKLFKATQLLLNEGYDINHYIANA